MAVVVPPHTTAPLETVRPVEVTRRVFTLEQALYVALFGLALLSHFWGLGDRALHHDETHHAFYSWLLFMGRGYTHDPLLHGPLLYHIGALIYFLFGDSNTTARVGVALFGSVLVVLPYLLRRELGRGAALLASVYLLVSPAFLYVGRFIRHDTYGVVFELLAFIGIVRYASTRQARWLYLCAAALGLMFANMETFFLYVAIFAPLLVAIFFWRAWKPGIAVSAVLALAIVALVFVLPGHAQQSNGVVQRQAGSYMCPSPTNPNPPDNPIVGQPGPLFGFGPLATADNDYSLCVRNQPDDNLGVYFRKLAQFVNHPAILLAIGLTIAAFVGLVYALIGVRRKDDGLTTWQRARATSDSTLEAFASLAMGKRGWIALALFLTIYGLFFSAFLTNTAGLVTGATGSFLYWLGQHGVERGGQPSYYYLLLLMLYEPLVLLWSTVGFVMVAWMLMRRLARREPAAEDAPEPLGEPRPINWHVAFPTMLAWWSLLTLFLYSWAGEKMPWLLVHVALPLSLLGAWALARTLRWGLSAVPWSVARATEPPAEIEAQDEDSTEAPHTEQPRDAREMPRWVARRALAFYLVGFGVIATYGFITLNTLSNPNQTPTIAINWMLALLPVILAVLTLGYGLVQGWRAAFGGLALALTVLGVVGSLRASYQINYRWGDVPREMLIYTQTSPDVARVLERLEQASVRRTGGLGMPVWYDNETVWRWYMRRFTNAQEQSPALPGPPPAEVQAVLMLQDNINSNPQNTDDLQGFRIQRFPLRWWFPEDQTYRLPNGWEDAPVNQNSPLLMRVLRTPTDSQTLAQAWQFLAFRQLPTQISSTDFVIAVRPELADEIGLGVGAQTPSR